MAVRRPYTFLMSGDGYDLVGMAGRDDSKTDQLPAMLGKLHKVPHATYETFTEALHLVGIAPEEESVH